MLYPFFYTDVNIRNINKKKILSMTHTYHQAKAARNNAKLSKNKNLGFKENAKGIVSRHNMIIPVQYTIYKKSFKPFF